MSAGWGRRRQRRDRSRGARAALVVPLRAGDDALAAAHDAAPARTLAVDLQRVFIILLENAVRYTPADGCITITTEADRETFRLTVADDGIGIDDDAQAHIFDQFYRAESARYIEGGTGLGLSIVKRIVELHQGAITVESELNVGTSFTITLPRELPL